MNLVLCPYCYRYVAPVPIAYVYPRHTDPRGGWCLAGGLPVQREPKVSPGWRPVG